MSPPTSDAARIVADGAFALTVPMRTWATAVWKIIEPKAEVNPKVVEGDYNTA